LAASGLERAANAGPPEHKFYATGDTRTFSALARRFLGPEVTAVENLTL
jgi:glutamate racemase